MASIARNSSGCCCGTDCVTGVRMIFNGIALSSGCIPCAVPSPLLRKAHHVIINEGQPDEHTGTSYEFTFSTLHKVECSAGEFGGLYELIPDPILDGSTACFFRREYFGFFKYQDLWDFASTGISYVDQPYPAPSDYFVSCTNESGPNGSISYLFSVQGGDEATDLGYVKFPELCRFDLQAEFKNDKLYIIGYLPRGYADERCDNLGLFEGCDTFNRTIAPTLFFFGVMDKADVNFSGDNDIDNVLTQECYGTANGPTFTLFINGDADTTPKITVYRNDTGAVVVGPTSSGVVHTGTGGYKFTNTSPLVGVGFRAVWTYKIADFPFTTNTFEMFSTYLPDEVLEYFGGQEIYAPFCVGHGGSVTVSFPATPHESHPNSYPCLDCNEFCNHCCDVMFASVDQDCSGDPQTITLHRKGDNVCQWFGYDVNGNPVAALARSINDADPPEEKWFFSWNLGDAGCSWHANIIASEPCPPNDTSETGHRWIIDTPCHLGRVPIVTIGCGEEHKCKWCLYRATWDYSDPDDCDGHDGNENFVFNFCWTIAKDPGESPAGGCQFAVTNPWPDIPIYPTWLTTQSDSGSDCQQKTVVVGCEGVEPEAPGTPNELPSVCIRCPDQRGHNASNCCNDFTIEYEDDDAAQTIYLAKVDVVPSGDNNAYSWSQIDGTGHFAGFSTMRCVTGASGGDPFGAGDRWRLLLYNADFTLADAWDSLMEWHEQCPPTSIHRWKKGAAFRPNGALLSITSCSGPP